MTNGTTHIDSAFVRLFEEEAKSNYRRMTRERMIDEAVRTVLSNRDDLLHLKECSQDMAAFCSHCVMWPSEIRAEFRRLAT